MESVMALKTVTPSIKFFKYQSMIFEIVLLRGSANGGGGHGGHGTPPFSIRLRTRHIFNLWDRGTLLTSFGEKEGIFVVVTINFNYVCTSFQFFSTF